VLLAITVGLFAFTIPGQRQVAIEGSTSLEEGRGWKVEDRG
jgi:hypothetical protein